MSSVAVELGSVYLRAVAASPSRQGIRIDRTLVVEVPPELDRTEPEQVGKWIGEQLSVAGFRRQRAIVALPREEVVLKRLVHPTRDESELPEMTRLAMERDLPFEGEDAIIDFIPIAVDETSTTVLAAALPGAAIDRTRRMMAAAGLRLQCLTLRTFGASAISEIVAEPDREVIAVDLIRGDGIEFTFSQNGLVRFSRAARISGGDENAMVGAAVREAQRTWLSRQVDDDQAQVNAGVVLGPDGVVDRVAAKVGALLKTPMEVLDVHPHIEANDQRLDRHWSLAGLLLARSNERQMLDFANPRQAPDPAAGQRKLALAVVVGIVLVVLGIWTMGNLATKRLQARIDTLESQQDRLGPAFLRHTRDKYRRGHLDLWSQAEVDWIGHLTHLDGLRPPIEDLVFDEISGSLAFDGVTRERRGKTWTADWVVGLTINGESRDRAIADGFRERLVETKTYTTASAGNDSSGGRRLPHGFTYRLGSVISDPTEAASDGQEPTGDSSDEAAES